MLLLKTFLIKPKNSDLKTYEKIENLQLVKETITRLAACYSILIFNKITR